MPAARRFAFARLAEPAARRVDGLGQLTILAREQHLLPPPQLVAQLPIAPRLRRLALERAALLVDFEDDVVDAGQVLLAASSFSSADAAAGLVLGDAGRFLDQLAPIGRAGAEDQPDLALLDDRVGLGAEAGVHQQIVDVAQAADLAVDQVFAVARSVQPPRDLDFARDRLNQLIGLAGRDMPVAIAVHAAVPVPIAMRLERAVAVLVAVMAVEVVPVGGAFALVTVGLPVFIGKRRAAQDLQDAAETQPDFGRGRRLARVAAVEDDVLHLLAAQALGALLAHHPRDGVGDVALAAAVGPDDGGDAFVEGQFRAVGERFEAVDFESFKTHEDTLKPGCRRAAARAVPAAYAGTRPLGSSPVRQRFWLGCRTTTDRFISLFAFRNGRAAPAEKRSSV